SNLRGEHADHTLLLKRGQSYRGPVSVRAFGQEGHPFTIAAYGTGDRPIITGGRTNLTIDCAGCQYIVIDGLEFSASTGKANVSIAHPAGHITVRNSHSHRSAANAFLIEGSSNNIIESSDASWSAREGIRILVGQPARPTQGNIIRNNKIHHNLRYGILTNGEPGQPMDGSGSKIYGNDAHNNSTGIYLVFTDRFEIFNNNLHDNGKDCQGINDCPGEDYGFAIQSGSYNDFHDNMISGSESTGIGVYGEQTPNIHPSDGNRLYRNVVFNTLLGPKWQRDINWQCWPGNTVGKDNQIFSNIFFGSGKNFVIGDSNPSISGNLAYNNVFYGGSTGVEFEARSTNAGWTFTNNIFAGNRDFALNAARRSGGLELLNNLYYKAGGGALVRYNGASYSPDSINVLDEKAITADPQFYGTAQWPDFRLQPGSPAIDRGLALGSDFQFGLYPPDHYWPPSKANQYRYGTGWEIGPFVYLPASAESEPTSMRYGKWACRNFSCP
ncbi:MAG: right-handed parallel beta-helix repeat-containing protein, partial [Chloroflexi bacterium]